MNPIVVKSHPRSGTHLCIDTLRRQFRSCRIYNDPFKRLDNLYFSIEELLDPKANNQFVYEKGIKIIQSCEMPIIKYHCYSEKTILSKHPFWADIINDSKQIYVYRNFYHVICSTYVYMQTFENIGKGVSLSNFIRQPFAQSDNRVQFWVDELKNEISKDSTNLCLKYEDFIAEPQDILLKLSNLLGREPEKISPVLPPKTNSRLRMKFNEYFHPNPPNTAILAEWNGKSKLIPRDEFTHEDLSFIENIAGPMLTALGYPILTK